MRIIVQKYGGSSVSDLTKIGAVADRVAKSRATGAAVVVVVSAMGNTTNELLALARELVKSPDRRELDMLVSVGERITMALLAMALLDRGVQARSLTGSQSGIITDESHADARVIEVRPDRILQHLEAGEVVVVAGFQGVSRAREVTTLGRGGSDTTAVVLAAALGAEHCEICSDVDGVFSADPRIVALAHQVPEMSLDEALALARGGAKVLLEDAVLYARDRGVTLQASATFGPGSGTRLSPGPSPRQGAVGVATDAQVQRVRVTGGAPALEALRAAGARLRRRAGDRYYLGIQNIHGAAWPEGVEDQGRTGLLTLVGSALGEDPGTIAAADAVLAGLGVEVREVWAQGDGLCWEIDPARLDEAARGLHAALVPRPVAG